MESVVTSTRDTWRALNFVELQRILESSAVEITSNHEKTDAAKCSLVNQTREFRKSVSDEVRKAVSHTLKSYQTEFDALLMRCKFSEDAYLTIYKKLIDLPDPIIALNEVYTLQKKSQKCSDYEYESRRLKETCEELRNEVQLLKSFERENKRLQKRVDELSDAIETERQAFNSKYQEELCQKLQIKDQEYLNEKLETEERISALEAKFLAASNALELSQSELFQLKSRVDLTESGRSTELELLLEDLEKSNSKIIVLEAELSKLRENRSLTSNEFQPEVDQLRFRIEELEAELSDKIEKNTNLMNKLDSLKSVKDSYEHKLNNQLEGLQSSLFETKTELDRLNVELAAKSDYDDIKRELDLLRSIEFSEPVESSNDKMLGQTRSSQSRVSLEVLLLRKNKNLKCQLADLNTSKEHLEAELSKLRANEIEYSQRVTEQTELIKLLESDLYRLQASCGDSTKLVGNSLQLSAPHSVGNHLAEVIGDTRPSDYGDQTSMLDIVQNQRDRYRKRVEELEQNESQQRQQLTILQREIESVRIDNVKLYEKIKFLHSYPNSSSPTASTTNCRTHVMKKSDPLPVAIYSDSGTKCSTLIQDSTVRDDATVAKYSKVYEANLNPFNQFSRSERQRVYANLKPHEKVMLRLGHYIVSNRSLRLAVFLYVLFIHILIFIALYKAAHYEHSAIEMEANCYTLFKKHMHDVHNEALGMPRL